MAANSIPIWSKVGDIQWGSTAVTTANTAKDGTGTQLTVWTSDATNGGFLKYLSFQPAGTNIASVARAFINNGSTNATAGNNIYFGQVSLPAITNSEVAAVLSVYMPMNIALPPGYKINIAIGTTVSSGWYVAGYGGKY